MTAKESLQEARRQAILELGNLVVQRGRLSRTLADLEAKIAAYERDLASIDQVAMILPDEPASSV